MFWRKLAYAGAVHGPWWWRRYTPPAFGTTFCAVLPKQRRAVAGNWMRMGLAATALEANLGALRTFVEFSLSLTDGLESTGKGLDGYSLDSPSDERLTELVRQKRGVILLTAHTGSWEVVGRLIGRRHGAALTMVMSQEANASARAFADTVRMRKQEGDFEIAYVGSDPLAALPLVSALRRGRIVAMQFDRVPPGMASVDAPFFGGSRAFPIGPFRLAQLTGAKVVVAFTRRVGHRRYAVEIPPVIELSKGRDESAIRVAAAEAAAALESFVRRNPAHWFHFEPLFA
ncbi:MAG: lysophospholipid acyltransferase family protein [Polyangiaceae bacterium]